MKKWIIVPKDFSPIAQGENKQELKKEIKDKNISLKDVDILKIKTIEKKEQIKVVF